MFDFNSIKNSNFRFDFAASVGKWSVRSIDRAATSRKTPQRKWRFVNRRLDNTNTDNNDGSVVSNIFTRERRSIESDRNVGNGSVVEKFCRSISGCGVTNQ